MVYDGDDLEVRRERERRDEEDTVEEAEGIWMNDTENTVNTENTVVHGHKNLCAGQWKRKKSCSVAH